MPALEKFRAVTALLPKDVEAAVKLDAMQGEPAGSYG